MDARSKRNLKTLLPQVRQKFTDWYDACHAQGLNVIITDGSRTYEEQAAIYAQGRTEPGPIVTKAKPGSSWHNFGIALDFGIFDGTDENGGVGHYHDESPDYHTAGKLAEGLGLEWGGDWKSIQDEPHVQWKTGISLEEARERHANGEAVV